MIIGVRFVGLTDQLERSMGVLICMQMIVVWEGLLLVLGFVGLIFQPVICDFCDVRAGVLFRLSDFDVGFRLSVLDT